MYIRTCIDISVIVGISAELPGVNELCVCVCSPHQCNGLLHTTRYLVWSVWNHPVSGNPAA